MAAIARDISGFENHGTYVGSFMAGPGLVPTDGDRGVRLDGAGYVAANAVVDELAGSAVVTFGVWARPDDVGLAMAIALNNNAADYNRFLIQWVGASGSGHWELNTALGGVGGSQITAEPGDPHPVGETSFVVGRFSTSAQRLYVDGVPVASSSYTGKGIPQTSDRFSIGQDFDNLSVTDRWRGVLDDAFAFDYGLSDADVAGLYSAGLAGGFREAVLALGPVGYWRLSDLGGFLVGAVGIG